MRTPIMRFCVDKSNITSETYNQIRRTKTCYIRNFVRYIFNFNFNSIPTNNVEKIESSVSSPQREPNTSTLISSINVYDRKLDIAETAGLFISQLTSVVIELEACLTKISRRPNGALHASPLLKKMTSQSLYTIGERKC